jgi:hypothetical protein
VSFAFCSSSKPSLLSVSSCSNATRLIFPFHEFS